jgi:hypothetical protein
MAYASDRKPLELTALTSLASDDTIIVGDTSDVSEVAKSITKADFDLGISVTASQVPDFDTEVANNTAVTANTAKTGITTGQANEITANTAKITYPSTDSTKVGFISVTQAVDLDTMESNIATNNAKISYTDAAAVALNTAKVSFDSTSSTRLADTSGTNTGDQTSIVGITGTKAQYDTSVTDGNFMYIGDAPTAHTHLLAAGATDVTATAAELNLLDGVTATTAELNFVDGVTSNVQTQLDLKAPLASPNFTGVVTYGNAIGSENNVGNLGSTETLNWDTRDHTGTLDANVTFTFSNAVDNKAIDVVLLYSGAQRTITYPTVTWLNNTDGTTAPVTPSNAGETLFVSFKQINGVIYASPTGNYAVYA